MRHSAPNTLRVLRFQQTVDFYKIIIFLKISYLIVHKTTKNIYNTLSEYLLLQVYWCAGPKPIYLSCYEVLILFYCLFICHLYASNNMSMRYEHFQIKHFYLIKHTWQFKMFFLSLCNT